ncbi:MAG: GUN4 domain-containing protein [Elainellaceae cyanobacterium]
MTQPSNSQPPQPKKPLEERFIDAAMKLIVIGSGGYALYNLYVDDVPKAAIAGIVALGSSLMTSFGQGLTKALSDRMKQRGESSGNLINQTVDTTVDKALTRLTRFHQQYLDALQTHCHNLKVEGYKGRLPRLVLEDVYVPLRVHSETASRISQTNRNREIWDLLPTAQHPDKTFPERLLAVIADPGYGKTTLMRFLTLSFANQTYIDRKTKELIPVLLLFRDFYQRIQSKTEPSLPQLIVAQVQQLPRCSELRASEPWFKDQLNQGKCLVMLDGLDEVPESKRDVVSQWANWQMQNYPSQFILTSRPHGYDPSLFEGVQCIEILDFNNDQKQTFITQWYRFITWELTWKRHWEESRYDPDPRKHLSRKQAEAESNNEAKRAADDLSRQLFADRSLTDLAKNPLLLTIISATHEAHEALPKRRINLYRQIFELLLEYRPHRRDTHLTIPNAEDNQKLLQSLAIQLMALGKTQFSRQQGEKWLKEQITEVCSDCSLTPRDFLYEMQQISGLLVGGEGELYEFAHKTFQEYLSALELFQVDGEDIILEKLLDPNWEEVICFYGALGHANKLIEIACERNDPYVLKLAKRIRDEGCNVDPDISRHLTEKLSELPEIVNVVDGTTFLPFITGHGLVFSSFLPATITLERKIQNLVVILEKISISDHITFGEYELFIRDQIAGQFHSWAEELLVSNSVKNRPVDDITFEDARWFCAWLSTQTNLVPDEGVYEYRLPTPEELEAVREPPPQGNSAPSLQAWTSDPNCSGNALRVVRQRIPDRYRELVNYLASGRWQEADQATFDVMLEVTDQKDQRCLSLESIRDFPCDDLLLIDRLWLQFSGGKFGFSVQKDLWVEVGGKLDFGGDEAAAEEAFLKMSDRNGWRKDNKYIDYPAGVTYDTTAPVSHLPSLWGGGVGRVSPLARIQTCKL